MPTCKDCINYTTKTADTGECKVLGNVPPDRDSERCPARLFRPHTK
ncbi:MAG: hypothetical protein JXA44_03155 [Methanospirillaceae archaeon]|nr:hypothetical protein [Methanospirillaceae archaeon]